MPKPLLVHPLRESIYCQIVKSLYISGIFLKEFIQTPTSVGSVCPSGKGLVNALIQALPPDSNGLIIDLGAGSGSVSQQLVKSGITQERILAVERSPGFSATFRNQCPQVPLIIGDARNLENIISRHDSAARVCAIISSLPLRVLPKTVVGEIMAEMRNVLDKRGGIFIQYTYVWWRRQRLQHFDFKPHSSQIILRNLPPAKVETYQLSSGKA